MATHLTFKQIQTVRLLGQGFNQRETAERMKIDRSTVSRWLQNSDFKELVEQLKEKQVQQLLNS